MPEHLPGSAALQAAAAAMRVTLTDQQAERILLFGDRLLRWNRAFNLISRKDEERIYERHLLDSLSPAPWIPHGRILDLGTGPGLPGIPLAIAMPQNHFTLVDRNERRIRFVTQSVQALGLVNVEARCGAAPAVAECASYDGAVTRAVAAPMQAWELVRSSLRPGGRLLVMASAQRPEPAQPGLESHRHEGRSEEATLDLPADVRLVAHEHLRIPGLEQRHGLIILEYADGQPQGLRTN